MLDEADLWVPQRVQPDGYALLNRIEEIVRRGRIRGFVPWLITQRPAVLHKDVLSQADVLVSMKLTASQDRDAVGRWIEGQADRAEGGRILAELPRLSRGEGWVWAPSDGVLARVAFPNIRSFDSSRTPKREERVALPRGLAAVDLAVVRRRLAGAGATTAGEHGAHGGPAAGGRGQVSDLERQLRHQAGELAAARVRVAALEAEAVVMQAQLAAAEGRGACAAPVSTRGGPPGREPLATLKRWLRRRVRCGYGWRGGDHHWPGAAAALEHRGQVAAGCGDSGAPLTGTEVRAVAAHHGVCESLLFTWRRQVRDGVLTAPEMPVFMPVQVLGTALGTPGLSRPEPPPAATPAASPPAPARRPQGGLIEIELGDGRQIRVGADVNQAALRRVLAALRG